MPLTTHQFVEQIHASPVQIVLAASGGGSRAIADLLEVPGASRTVLEAVVPYCEKAVVQWLGGRPDQFCSPAAARAMAMAAFLRARDYYSGPEYDLAGVACTASLASDRPKRGPHRAHLAVQTQSMTANWSVQLEKGHRSRVEEEELVGRAVLNAIGEACGLTEDLPLDLLDSESAEHHQTRAPLPWQNLLLGKVEAICHGDCDTSPRAILSGAFNPVHAGHRQMTEVGQRLLGVPVVTEISILNADKPPLDYYEIDRRLAQFAEGPPVILTRASTFEEKSRLFPGAIFLVGIDTLRRIADPRYYGGNPAGCQAALERIAERGCRFLVFGRDVGTGFVRLGDLDLPDGLEALCREVPGDVFREDVSSTAIRRAGGW